MKRHFLRRWPWNSELGLERNVEETAVICTKIYLHNNSSMEADVGGNDKYERDGVLELDSNNRTKKNLEWMGLHYISVNHGG